MAVVQNAAAQSPSLVLSATSLDVTEGSNASYTVTLATLPTADVMVSIGGTAGTDLTLITPSLTFTTSNWNTAQSVTVRSAPDSDALNDSVTLSTVTVAPNGGSPDEYMLSANRELTIAAGATESTGEVIFTSLDDFTYTGTRYFDATLTPDHARVAADTESFAVVDDDNTRTALQVTPSKIFENGGTATRLGIKSGLHEGVVKMTVSLEPSGRATLSGTTLTFQPGALYATETLTITAVDNAMDEPDQAITISATVTEGRGIRTRPHR